MNLLRRRIIAIHTILIAVMIIYPPYVIKAKGMVKATGYSWLWCALRDKDYGAANITSVDQLYEFLLSNYIDVPDRKTFDSALLDKDKRLELLRVVQKDYYDVPDFKTYEKIFGKETNFFDLAKYYWISFSDSFICSKHNTGLIGEIDITRLLLQCMGLTVIAVSFILISRKKE
jgi:hypothetical protein